MTLNRILRLLLNIKGATVDDAEFDSDARHDARLTVHVHVQKKYRWRCPICGKTCHVHDYVRQESFWRGMDFGSVAVWIGAKAPRVSCPEHGVLRAHVPWAKAGSQFTLDFAYSAAWLVRANVNRSKIAEVLRIDWETVGRLANLVRKDLEPDPGVRFNGLVRIGVDETSYSKGHKHITVIINHDTNTVVWASVGYGKAVLDSFFKRLTPEQRASIELVSGDGARWITSSVAEYCPNAKRCLDTFHVVEWANDAIDGLRIDAWRAARIELNDMIKTLAPKDRGAKADEDSKAKIDAAKKHVEEIKHSRYALGKNPENLTTSQRARLELIQAEDPRLARAHQLKERLRIILRMHDRHDAEVLLDKWFLSARHCRQPQFVELQRKIRRNRDLILNTIEFGLNNARVEATNNKIKLLIRIAYGFRNTDLMISLILLCCSSLKIPWPRLKAVESMKSGVK